MPATLEVVKFGDKDAANSLAKMSPAELDQLSFGAVQLDATGKILQYNAGQGEIVGRDPKAVLGKNFFTEVAPCTKTPTFFGKFQEGVKKGDLNAQFEYTFNYNMKPTQVKVHMKKALTDNTFWVFVKKA